MVEKFGRLVAYLPLAGTALILIFQDFVKGFLPAFTLGPAVAAMAVSVILLIWYFEGALRRQEQAFGRMSAVVAQVAAGQQKILEQAAPNFGQVGMGEAFQMAADIVPSVRHLRVYAVTSQQIISFLQHSGIRAERCSLLIRSSVAVLPLLASQLDATILDWRALADQGVIGSLDIRRYDFPPLEYEAIFDSSLLIHGLYYPSAARSYGVRVMTPIVVHAQTAAGARLVSAHVERFDCLFESCAAQAAGRKGTSAGRRVRASAAKSVP